MANFTNADPGGFSKNREIAELFDHTANFASKNDIPFYVGLSQEIGGKILELGMGSGRVLIPLARTGLEVVGVDLSPFMTELCREHLRQEPDSVQRRAKVFQADMRNFDAEDTFNLILLPFRPFQQLLNIGDQLSCLEAVRQHLVPKGMLAFDVFNPRFSSLASIAGEPKTDPPFTMRDGRVVTRWYQRKSVNTVDQIMEIAVRYLIVDGAVTREHAFSYQLRYFSRYELVHLLYRAGFDVKEIYGSFNREPFGSREGGDIIIVAQRQ